MLTAEQLNSLNLVIDTDDEKEVIMANAALEWIGEHTTIDITDLENLPSGAKLFILEFCDMNSIPYGVASESISGLSQSFTSGNKANMIWDLAYTYLSSYVKSQLNFIPTQKRFI